MSEGDNMKDKNSHSSESRAPGTTTIAPNVLVTIAQLTALRVEGVVGLAPLPPAVDRLFRRGLGDGVDIAVEDGEVNAELYLVLAPNVNVRDVSRQVQSQVARAIEEMVGMQAARIDVHIQDIAYGDPAE
jgi:uncharacterized alkaline shock family protein YloU